MPLSAARRYPFFSGVKGRLLLFNVLVVALTLATGIIAVFGFNNAGKLLTKMQETHADGNEQWHGGRREYRKSGDRCGESDAVIGALEYQSESGQLKNALQSLQNSLAKMAAARLAQKQPQLIDRIHQRSNELQDSVRRLLT